MKKLCLMFTFWRTKNNEVLTKNERIDITETTDTYTLKIDKAVMTDAGNYTLKLTNTLGSESKSAEVTVKCEFDLIGIDCDGQ